MKCLFSYPRFQAVFLAGSLIFLAHNSSGQGHEQFAIQTSQESYEVTTGRDAVRYISVDIASVFTNPMKEAVFFKGCRPPNPPILEKKTEDEWVVVYSPTNLLCESPPIQVIPGKAIDLPSSIIACLSGQNCGPEFKGEIAGTYRLRAVIHLQRDGYEKLPIESSVSNSFTLYSNRN